MEEKIDRILLLLEDENVGLCSRVKCLERTVNGNGKPGIAEQVRGLQNENSKRSAAVAGGISLIVLPVWEYIKHKMGW
mgnify:CR=1 FL=1